MVTERSPTHGGRDPGCVTDSAAVTFGYVGYVWAILCCGSITLFLGVIGLTLYVIGKRAERRAPRTVVHAITPAAGAAIDGSGDDPSGGGSSGGGSSGGDE